MWESFIVSSCKKNGGQSEKMFQVGNSTENFEKGLTRLDVHKYQRP